MEKGLVYILTNPCLDGWVKIGMTERDDIESRLRELNSPTNIPLSCNLFTKDGMSLSELRDSIENVENDD